MNRLVWVFVCVFGVKGATAGADGRESDLPNTDIKSNFTISLDLIGVDDDTEFQSAMDKWRTVIVGDIPDFSGQLGGESSCGPWPLEIDDVYLCGRYDAIDGPGGVLGSASPRHYRPTEVLPLTGAMSFDTDDVGRIEDLAGVIMHEMAHVLGVGPLWTVSGLITSFSTPCSYKVDSAASREYQELSGCAGRSIPLEEDISTSNCVHWSEGCFTNEVMSSAANADFPISRLTIAALEDIGYQVDYDQAEEYGTANMNPSCLCNSRLRRSLEDEERVRNLHGSGRKLSEEGRQNALAYGTKLLAANKNEGPLKRESIAIDLGGELVYVLYLENDSVYSIMVTADS